MGQNLKIIDSLPSTNDYVKEQLANSKPFEEGTVIMANEQTEGRGQRGSVWKSSKGENLTFSYLLKPDFLPASSQFLLTCSVSLGLVKFLKQYIPDVFIKWPNDIMAGNKKICGILIENTLRGQNIKNAVVGIGLNVNQTEFPALISQATSLKKETSGTENFNRELLLKDLLRFLSEEYYMLKNSSTKKILKEYNEFLFMKHKDNVFLIDNQEVEAFLLDIEEDGFLRLKIEGEIKKYGLKEVKMLF